MQLCFADQIRLEFRLFVAGFGCVLQSQQYPRQVSNDPLILTEKDNRNGQTDAETDAIFKMLAGIPINERRDFLQHIEKLSKLSANKRRAIYSLTR